VILTGSQIPLSELFNDSIDNLLGALIVAGHYTIPEVCLFFNHKLLRGNRSIKASSEEFDAFDSPNLAPLANVGIEIGQSPRQSEFTRGELAYQVARLQTLLGPRCCGRACARSGLTRP